MANAGDGQARVGCRPGLEPGDFEGDTLEFGKLESIGSAAPARGPGPGGSTLEAWRPISTRALSDSISDPAFFDGFPTLRKERSGWCWYIALHRDGPQFRKAGSVRTGRAVLTRLDWNSFAATA